MRKEVSLSLLTNKTSNLLFLKLKLRKLDKTYTRIYNGKIKL